MAEQQVGQLLDALGVTVDLEQGDLPTDALVILKAIRADGSVALIKGRSESVDWVTALGMMTAAQTIENSGFAHVCDEEDE